MPTDSINLLSQQLRIAHKNTIKRKVQNIIDILRDRWDDQILDELANQVTEDTYQKYKWLVTKELNLLKRTMKELSVVYKTPPVRKAVIEAPEINGEDVEMTMQSDTVYDELMEDTTKNMVMQNVNLYTNASNHTMVKVTYRNEKLDYDQLNFNNVETYTNPDDWMEIIAVKHHFGLEVDELEPSKPNMKLAANEGLAVGNVSFPYTTAKVWVIKDIPRTDIVMDGTDDILQGGKIYTVQPVGNQEIIIKEDDIPYLDRNGNPILPFVLVNKSWPVDQLLNFTDGDDLRDLNLNVAIMLIFLNTIMKYQSFKQIVVNTDDPDSIPKPLRLGPAQAIINKTKDGSGSVNTLDLQTSIDIFWQTMEKRILTVLAGYNVSPQNFMMSGDAASGISLKISNIGKIEAREAQIPFYREAEKKIFNIERIIWNYHNPIKKISEDAKFTIDFAELDFPATPDEIIKQDEFDLRHNLTTDIDILMRENPDLTEEQALQIYQKNKVFNDANKPIINIQPFQQPGGQNAEQEEDEEQEAS